MIKEQSKIIPIRIMSRKQARSEYAKLRTSYFRNEDFRGPKSLYFIQIFGTGNDVKRFYGNLQNFRDSDILREYYFDDVKELTQKTYEENPGEEYESINEKIARNIVSDFSHHRNSIDELWVHCLLGQSRSPAVAAALNEIFNLGNDKDELMAKYFDTMNPLVYGLMIENRDAA